MSAVIERLKQLTAPHDMLMDGYFGELGDPAHLGELVIRMLTLEFAVDEAGIKRLVDAYHQLREEYRRAEATHGALEALREMKLWTVAAKCLFLLCDKGRIGRDLLVRLELSSPEWPSIPFPT